jgi:hypothetical protein
MPAHQLKRQALKQGLNLIRNVIRRLLNLINSPHYFSPSMDGEGQGEGEQT